MPEICTNSVSPSACGHYVVTINDIDYHLHTNELVPLSDDEYQTFIRLAIRYKGITLPQLQHRTVHGDEATNVKIYSFFGPGASITKSNIGVNYVNICPGSNGERLFADFTGCTEYRLMLHANLVGTGQWGARIIRTSDNVALHQADNLGPSGERELDTDWQPLPVAFLGQTLVSLVAQAKSTTGADDPVFRSLRIGLR